VGQGSWHFYCRYRIPAKVAENGELIFLQTLHIWPKLHTFGWAVVVIAFSEFLFAREKNVLPGKFIYIKDFDFK
jgi:hypothetical protein